MLLVQSFDPLKEQLQQQLEQQKKLPFFRIILRTRRALSEFKNKMHENIANRHIQAIVARDHRIMIANTSNVPPPQQPWYGGCNYDPYFTAPPPPPLMMLPPPLVGPPYPIHPQQVPYCICVHLTSPPQVNNSMYFSPSSSIGDSTLYSSSDSSMYSGNEKELMEEVEYEHHHPIHPLQEINYYSSNLTRRNSDIMHDRQRNNRRPSLQSRRWNSSNSHSVYYD
ncbi:unnamed protein product [Mucor hiemalis]